jgi:hypothetical protein
MKLAENCHDLRNLNVQENYDITDRSIIKIAKNCPRLTSLNISKCDGLTDICMFRLAEMCVSLKILDITDLEFSYESIMAVVSRCPDMNIITEDKSEYMGLGPLHIIGLTVMEAQGRMVEQLGNEPIM